MPTRRTMELVILTVILLQPAMAMIKLWMQKHIVTTGNDVTSDAARAVEQLL